MPAVTSSQAVSRALEQRPGLGGEDLDRLPCRRLGVDDPEGGAEAGGGQPPGVAVGEQAVAGGQLGPAGLGHAGAGGPVLLQDPHGLGQGEAAQLGGVGGPGRGGRHPADRPAQVDRGRPGHREHARRVPGRPAAASPSGPGRGGPPRPGRAPPRTRPRPRWRAPHGQAAKGVHDLGRGGRREHDQAVGEEVWSTISSRPSRQSTALRSRSRSMLGCYPAGSHRCAHGGIMRAPPVAGTGRCG